MMACNCRMCGAYMDGNTRMVMLKEPLWLSITYKKDIVCDDCIETKLLKRKIKTEDLGLSKPPFKVGEPIPVNITWAKIKGIPYGV